MKNFVKILLCFAIPVAIYYYLRFNWFEVYDNYGNYAFKDFITPLHIIAYGIVVLSMCFSAIFLGLNLYVGLHEFSCFKNHPTISYIFKLILTFATIFVLGFSAVNLKWELYMPICLALAGPTLYGLFTVMQVTICLFGLIVRFFLKNIYDLNDKKTP